MTEWYRILIPSESTQGKRLDRGIAMAEQAIELSVATVKRLFSTGDFSLPASSGTSGVVDGTAVPSLCPRQQRLPTM
jgi:hypothetical protein